MISGESTFKEALADAAAITSHRLGEAHHWLAYCGGARQSDAAKRRQLDATRSALADFEYIATMLPADAAALWRAHFAREAESAQRVVDALAFMLSAPSQLGLFDHV